eukprot:COSAG01_NODE_5378_length_4297_cov_3.601953_7_plen_145_part_01
MGIQVCYHGAPGHDGAFRPALWQSPVWRVRGVVGYPRAASPRLPSAVTAAWLLPASQWLGAAGRIRRNQRQQGHKDWIYGFPWEPWWDGNTPTHSRMKPTGRLLKDGNGSFGAKSQSVSSLAEACLWLTGLPLENLADLGGPASN